MEQQEPSSIIIRMPNWLGDAIMATPVLTAVREKWPNARLVVMITKSLAPLFEKDPRVDEVFAFTRPKGFLHRLQSEQIIERLREGAYDMGILLTNSFSSAWWFYRSRIKTLVGFGRKFLFSKSRPLPKNYKKQHLVHSYLQLLDVVGIPFKERPLELFVTREEKDLALEKYRSLSGGSKRLIIGINPGAAFGPAKCWPSDRFRELTKKLLEDERILVVFFGDQAASSLVEDILRGLPERAVNLAGKTHLREFIALVSTCDLFITNDSGPMHVAAGLGTPLIALFGSTSDVMTGPYKTGDVIHKNVSCSPCFLRECPLDFRCMKAIEVADVMQIVKRRLKRDV